VALDVGSAAGLQASLSALREHPDAKMLAIIQLLATKPMQVSSLPLYFSQRSSLLASPATQ